MQLWCGGIFNNCFIANCPESVRVKELRKLANICQRYGQLQSGTFFLRHSVVVAVVVLILVVVVVVVVVVVLGANVVVVVIVLVVVVVFVADTLHSAPTSHCLIAFQHTSANACSTAAPVLTSVATSVCWKWI